MRRTRPHSARAIDARECRRADWADPPDRRRRIQDPRAAGLSQELLRTKSGASHAKRGAGRPKVRPATVTACPTGRGGDSVRRRNAAMRALLGPVTVARPMEAKTKFVFLKACVGSDGVVTPSQTETISIRGWRRRRGSRSSSSRPHHPAVWRARLLRRDAAGPATGSPPSWRTPGLGRRHLRHAGHLRPGDRPVQPEDPPAGDLREPAADPHRRRGRAGSRREARELRVRAGDRAARPP